jgi:hypothetical protein
MSINNLLLWEKWRPSKIEDIILPDRITNHFKNGITKNFIFYRRYFSQRRLQHNLIKKNAHCCMHTRKIKRFIEKV